MAKDASSREARSHAPLRGRGWQLQLAVANCPLIDHMEYSQHVLTDPKQKSSSLQKKSTIFCLRTCLHPTIQARDPDTGRSDLMEAWTEHGGVGCDFLPHPLLSPVDKAWRRGRGRVRRHNAGWWRPSCSRQDSFSARPPHPDRIWW
jgi:hypothetical protein